MKYTLGIAIGMFCCLLSMFGSEKTGSFEETHPLVSGGTISLENVNGVIAILTWDRPEVRIEVAKSARTAEEFALIDLTIDSHPDRIAICVKLPKRPRGLFRKKSTIRAEVRFTLTVPADCNLDGITNVNSGITIEGVCGRIRASAVNGAISAQGTAGDIDLNTVNGKINATGLGGNVNLESVNGALEAEFTQWPANGVHGFKTVNGNITLRLPDNTAADVDASVLNGTIHSGFPVTVHGTMGKRKLQGRIGSGGARLNVTAMNGSIRIEATR